jgi:hypothetical protein
VLEQPGADGHSDQDQHASTDEFGPLSQTIAQTSADLQTKQRERHADGGDDHRGNHEIDAIGTEGEADDQIVDAQGGTDEYQPLEAGR